MANRGRPTKYSQKILDLTYKYIEMCEDETIQETVGLSAKGTELFKNKIQVKLPSVEGLAYYLHIDKTSIYEWEKLHQEFSHALSELRAKQANVVLNKGLSGDYNPTIAKLILSNNHGYKERTDTTTNEKPVVDTFTQEQKENLLNLIK